MNRRGILISIEGIDGTGKTTQALLLKEWLERHGREAVVLKEPTAGAYGAEISKRASAGGLSPNEEHRLFMLDRKDDVKKNILPALEANKTVIMDRYYQSNMSYQGARGLSVQNIREDNERFSPAPDLIIILDVDPRLGMSRVKTRKSVDSHFENEAYLEKVREIFLRIGKEPNAVVIEADAPVEEVHKRIIGAIEERLPALLENV